MSAMCVRPHLTMLQVIAYLLPAGSFSEFWPVITNVVFGLPQILSSFLMIIIWYTFPDTPPLAIHPT